MISLLPVDWGADPPLGVGAGFTTRVGGVSEAPWDAFNLGVSAGDRAQHVARNREQLTLELPAAPRWLRQCHGTTVLAASAVKNDESEADAQWSDNLNEVCAVLSADCLPVLLAAQDGSAVAAVHAGWKGLAHGVIDAAVGELQQAGHTQLRAALGPAIGPQHFEVGDEVLDDFAGGGHRLDGAWRRRMDGKALLDLYLIAQRRLSELGVRCGPRPMVCTYRDQDQFFSYRRDGVTGRQAALIWRCRY
ncbi:peptidoglycan editing factor PgeF [Gammaproteobacteria bacterium]|nr:peptidoglycan editing factor PgeF [Gammaproteobacteria bacterium]